MKIVVCIKQVPDVQDIQWTENNTMKREGVESIINPFDLYAIQYALNIKNKIEDTQIIAVSMGPNQAEKALREAIALGCDDGILLSDRRFAASDTLATSKILASAIKKYIPIYDLIICGQFAIDGDTAQTGVGVAENLNILQTTFVEKLIDVTEKTITVQKKENTFSHIVKLIFPSLISVLKNEEDLPYATISRQILSQRKEIKIVDAEDLGIDFNEIGIKGSPTYVSGVFKPTIERLGEQINNEEALAFLSDIAGKTINE